MTGKNLPGPFCPFLSDARWPRIGGQIPPWAKEAGWAPPAISFPSSLTGTFFNEPHQTDCRAHASGPPQLARQSLDHLRTRGFKPLALVARPLIAPKMICVACSLLCFAEALQHIHRGTRSSHGCCGEMCPTRQESVSPLIGHGGLSLRNISLGIPRSGKPHWTTVKISRHPDFTRGINFRYHSPHSLEPDIRFRAASYSARV